MTSRRIVTAGLVVSLIASGALFLRSGSTSTVPGDPGPWIEDLARLTQDEPLPPGRPAAARLLGHTAGSSLYAVQLRTAIRPHYHAEHDELVCVIAGAATVRLDERHVQVGPGTTMWIPRGTVHAVENVDTTRIVVALSCFTPTLDGEDRHVVDDGD